jgi:GAF domain-containing protein
MAGSSVAAGESAFTAACERACVGEAGRVALVAFACADTAGPIVIAATAGTRDAVAALHLGTGQEVSSGLLGAALLQRRPVVCHHSRNDPAHARWSDRAWRAGFRAACAIPFDAGPGRTGVLGVFSPQDQAFGADELDRLVEIAEAVAGHGHP